MQYFKHYHNANTSLKLQRLIHEGGVSAYGYYWLMMELLCEKFDGETITIELFERELVNKFCARCDKVLNLVQLFTNCGLIVHEFSKLTYKVEAPILAELQDRDFKRARKERGKGAPKNKNKDKEIRIRNKNNIIVHEKFSDDFLNPYLLKVKNETQEAWIKAFSDTAWIKLELIKAVTWLINKGVTRKNIGQYFTNWLNNAFKNKGAAKKSMSGYAEEMFNNNPYDREVVA